jgi:transcription elongation factor Elf1
MAFQSDEERRAYFREYNKGWYQRHKERLLEKRKQHYKKLREWIIQYKSNLYCILCGEAHPACLQFHHRNREEKSFTISHLIARTHVSIDRLKKEIDKCDILCGNCHAKLHWQERREENAVQR